LTLFTDIGSSAPEPQGGITDSATGIVSEAVTPVENFFSGVGAAAHDFFGGAEAIVDDLAGGARAGANALFSGTNSILSGFFPRRR
jgi:hypothetical protein